MTVLHVVGVSVSNPEFCTQSKSDASATLVRMFALVAASSARAVPGNRDHRSTSLANARAFPRPKPRLAPTTTVVLPEKAVLVWVSMVFVPFRFPGWGPDAGNDGRPERADARSGEVGWRLLPHASLAVVLVVAAVPDAGLVAPAWRAVQPLVHAPESVQPARVRRVGVVDDAIRERERAHTRCFPRIRWPVRSNGSRDRRLRWTLLADLRRPSVHRAEVVLDDSRLLLLLGVRRLEVVVEVAAERRRPREAPAHPLLVRLQLRERSPRHRAERDVVIGEVDDGAVEAVRDRRAGRTACRVLGPEHEVVDEELRTSSEEIGEGHCVLVGLEAVLLVDPDPGQFLPPPRQLVALPRQRLLGLQQLQPGRKPLFTCADPVIGHGFSPSCCHNNFA